MSKARVLSDPPLASLHDLRLLLTGPLKVRAPLIDVIQS